MKKVTGYCEVQKKETTVYIDVIGSRALEDEKESYILGRIDCEYATVNFDDRCNNCPLRKLVK